MECKVSVKNGAGGFAWGRRTGWASRGQHQLCGGGASDVRLDFAPAVPGAPARRKMHHVMVPAEEIRSTDNAVPVYVPFMSNMDEISYWIYTKRAPCLMNYDNVIKKQNEEAHCSKSKPKSIASVAEVPSPKKKKKRKLSLLDEDSLSGKRQNVYFDTSQTQKKTVISNGGSDTLGSDVDFNIKNSSVQEKPKRKLQKNSRTILHKKNTVVTSTPKVCTLRRSLRQAQQTLNNNSQLNSSFEILNTSIINGNSLKHSAIEQKPDKLKKPTGLLAGGDQSVDDKKKALINNNFKNDILNGQFEDLSDVSGFTANYIRSTKLQSKSPRKLRCKNSRHLVKESRPSLLKDNTIICVNKSMNTGLQKSTILNCSTDSSQNIIKLVTGNANAKSPTKVSKSTSVLKFMDSKTSKSRESVMNSKLEHSRTRSKPNLNISFESKNSSTSRYPKRYKNNATGHTTTNTSEVDKRKKNGKNTSEFNNSDRKENPEATSVSKTRSGRSIGLTLRQPENSVLVLSNSTDQVSSMASMNVATPSQEQGVKMRKKRRATRHARMKKSMDKSVGLQSDSLRDKSGFAACFSDSDEDSEPLKQRKFFCA